MKFLLNNWAPIGFTIIYIFGWYATLTYDDGYFWINIAFMCAFSYIIFIMYCNLIRDIKFANVKGGEQ